MALSRKHLKLDQARIDKARQLLGLATEQETLDRALDLVIVLCPFVSGASSSPAVASLECADR